MLGALFLLKFICVHGFLLNTNIARNTSEHQYLRMSDYYDDQRTTQQKLDNKMAILVSQIQDTFASLENKITKQVKENETSSVLHACEDKYHTLEVNFKKLEASFKTLMVEHSAQRTELDTLRDKTNQYANEIANLKTLKTIQPIQEVNNMRSNVQDLIKRTHDLSVNQLARNQDFLALYNETIAIKASQKAYYQDVVALKNETNFINETIWNFTNDKVALTACAPGNSAKFIKSHIVTLPNIRSQIGIGNISAFQSSGKFICEKEGLYLILVSMVTQTPLAQFRIKKNDSIISWNSISNDTHLDTGTFHAVLDLQINDYVWVQTVKDFTEYSGFSCWTIIKVN